MLVNVIAENLYSQVDMDDFNSLRNTILAGKEHNNRAVTKEKQNVHKREASRRKDYNKMEL